MPPLLLQSHIQLMMLSYMLVSVLNSYCIWFFRKCPRNHSPLELPQMMVVCTVLSYILPWSLQFYHICYSHNMLDYPLSLHLPYSYIADNIIIENVIGKAIPQFFNHHTCNNESRAPHHYTSNEATYNPCNEGSCITLPLSGSVFGVTWPAVRKMNLIRLLQVFHTGALLSPSRGTPFTVTVAITWNWYLHAASRSIMTPNTAEPGNTAALSPS